MCAYYCRFTEKHTPLLGYRLALFLRYNLMRTLTFQIPQHSYLVSRMYDMKILRANGQMD